MAWYSLLELPIAWRLGWTLVHFLWQGACLLLLVQMILLLLNRESANSRYLAMVCGLLAMAAMPVLTFSRLASSPPPATTGEVFASTGETSAETQPIATTASPRTRVSEVSSPQRAKQSDQPTSSGRHNATANAWVPWLSAAWAIGVLMGSLRLIAGWWAIGALRKDRQFPCGEGAARAALDRMCAIVGVRAECVELIESARASTPLVVGWLRPAILLPVGMATGMTTSEMEAVFAHELAHIRRADYVVNLLQSLVETWLFFHPAVWLLSAWVRAERELCCDDIAVAAVGDRLAYARTLAKLAESARAAGLGVPATGGRVYERIQRIAGSADTQRRSHAWLPGVLAIACLLCAAATLIDTSPVDASAPPADERASNERAAGAAAAQPAAQASPLVIQLPNGDIKFNFEKTAWSDALAAAAAGIGYEIHIARDAPGVITHTSKRGYSKNEAIRLLKLELLKRGREMRFDKGSNRFEVVDANRAARERKTELLDAPPLKEHFELLDYRFGSKGRFAPARVFRFKAKRDIAAKELARLLGREFDDRSFRRWSDGERVVVDGYVVRQDDKWRGKNPPNVPVGDTLEVWKNAGYGWNERELFPKRTLIAGVVRDADGPVAGAIVSASYSEGRALGGNYGSTVTTAGDGRFDVRITDSSYARMKTVSLTVSAKGRAPRRVGPFEVAAGKDLDPVDVMLDNGFTAEIRFASAVTGAAVTSGVVTVRQSGYSHPPRFEGLFQDVVKAAHVSRNPLRVTVRASGYEEAYFNNVELPPDGRLTLELHPTKQAGFRLVSEITGRALADVPVRYFNSAHADSTVRPFPSQRQREEVWARSDAEGRVRLPSLRGPDRKNPDRANFVYWFYIAPPGHSPAYIGPIAAGQQLGDVRVGKTHRVSVKVIVPPDSPLPVRVEWDQPLRQNEGARNAATTKSFPLIREPGEHVFQLQDLRRGRFRVIARYGKGTTTFGYVYGQRKPSKDDVVVEISDLNSDSSVDVRPTGGRADPGKKPAREKQDDDASRAARQKMLDSLKQLNSKLEVDQETRTRIKRYEEAFRLQSEIGSLTPEELIQRQRILALRNLIQSLRMELARIEDDRTERAYRQVISHLENELKNGQ